MVIDRSHQTTSSSGRFSPDDVSTARKVSIFFLFPNDHGRTHSATFSKTGASNQLQSLSCDIYSGGFYCGKTQRTSCSTGKHCDDRCVIDRQTCMMSAHTVLRANASYIISNHYLWYIDKVLRRIGRSTHHTTGQCIAPTVARSIGQHRAFA